MKSRGLIIVLLLLLVWAVDLSLAFHGPVTFASRFQLAESPDLALVSPISGFSHPVSIANALDGSGRLFIVEQGGRIRIIKNGVILNVPFLDISDRISTGVERGLLGLAFPAGFPASGRFYVNYTNANGDTIIARYRRSATDNDLANAGSEEIVLTIAQPFPTHNGGQVAFGPDGFLYIGVGDGGDAGDPGNRAQDPDQLLGKILRINVEAGEPATYTVPTSNPFVNTAGYRHEIWALGLRNPWRFSFDRLSGDLYLADVGQSSWEEVNFQLAADPGGQNYGWRITEGNHCFNPTDCSFTGITLPVWEYSHSLGCSVTGGYVYRGVDFPRMQGTYFYGDFCSGRIWMLRRAGAGWENTQLLDTNILISTFGEDEHGNIYVADYNAGTVYQIIDQQLPPTPTPTPTATPTPPPTPTDVTFEFGASQFEITEDCATASVLVTRAGPNLENRTDTVDYSIVDDTARQKSDYTLVSGQLTFAAGQAEQLVAVPITEDAFAEGNEKATLVLTNPSGNSVLGMRSVATLLIQDDDQVNGPANPIDDPALFVGQHYHDFLSRQSDPDGQDFWTSQLEACAGDPLCIDDRRQNVSGAFFLSIEFQETGYLAYRFYKSAFGQTVRYADFLRDTQRLARGVQVGKGSWAEQLEANKTAFASEFVTRPDFMSKYPSNMSPAAYVDTLNGNTGGVLSPTDRDILVAGLTSGSETRATVLRRIADDDDLKLAERNRAFVLMQYFGYLRRNPDDAPDDDLTGYNFWLTKLNDANGDFVRAEMVRSFLLSREYRERFGQP